MKLKRDVELARKAFKKKDKKLLVKAHDTEHKELHDVGKGKYIKSAVYGGLDGTITTFAVVAGSIGAAFSSSVMLILGFANLIADGISMAVGDYLSTKSQKEYYKTERKREEWEVKNNPKGEEKEMIEIYMKKGLNKKDSIELIKILKRNKKFWVDTMMHDELELENPEENAKKNAIITFFSFLIFGFIPLMLYLFGAIFNLNIKNGFLLTAILTGIAMFTLGSLKTKITGKNWLKSGFETLLIGGLAASAAYFVGHLLSKII